MKKILALILALALLAALGCGCAKTETSTSSTESSAAPESESPAAEAPVAEAPEEDAAPEAEEPVVEEEPVEEESSWVYAPLEYPLDNPDNVVFDYWVIMDLSSGSDLETLNDHPVVQRMNEYTGVGLNLIINSQYSGTEKTNLMYASGEYPDFIANFNYASGTEAAIDDDIVFDMKDMLPEYAPDYWQYLQQEELYKAIATDNGAIATFAGIGTPSRGPGEGFMIRQDWLDELGLDVPVTYDDYYNVLTAFKNAYEPADPLWLTLDGVLSGELLCGGFGVKLKVDSQASSNSGFFLEDGEIKFGYMEDGLVDYLELMNKWYSEGLISTEFTTHITEMRDEGMIESILTGGTGVFTRGDGLIDMLNKRGQGENYHIIAIADAVQNEGDIIPFGYSTDLQAGGGIAMTTQCEYPELGMQWANYWYTDEGFILGTYGIEGLSFEYDEAGEPQYTEMMTNDPQGRPLSARKIDYTGFVQLRTDNSKPEASYSQEAQDAPVIWASNRSGDGDFPTSATMTAQEGEEFTVIFSDITTYCSEHLVRFIIGDRPLSEVPEFQEQIKAMNIDRCIELWQQALDRYNSR